MYILNQVNFNQRQSISQQSINLVSDSNYTMKIALFSKTWPRHNYNGLGQKTISLVESLINMSHSVLICSAQEDLSIKQQLKQYPVELFDINERKISTSMSNLSKNKFKPNFFIFDSVETEEKYSAFIYNKWNKSPRVLILNQLKGLQRWRKNNYKLISNFIVPQGPYMSPEKLEQIIGNDQMHSIMRSDYVITSNQHNYFLLNKYFYKNSSSNTKNKYLSYLNFGLPSQQFHHQVKNLMYRPFKNRSHFIHFGNFESLSNQDSLFVLLTMVWPIIRNQIPEAQLHVYGSYKSSGISSELVYKTYGQNSFFKRQNLSKMGVIFKGYMKQTETLSQYRALLHPCAQTTGPHIKIVESWFNHLPVVTTPVGAEGLFLETIDLDFTQSEDTFRNVFANERIHTEEQKRGSQKLKNYFSNRIFGKGKSNLSFGGSYDNYTYKEFADSAVKIYKDEEYWKKCLQTAQNIIKRNQSQHIFEMNLKNIMVNVEIATYQGRGRQSYQQQWRRYTKSAEFNKKLRS